MLLKIPRDHWTTELEDATCGYVIVKNLPMYPVTDIVSNIAPDKMPFF